MENNNSISWTAEELNVWANAGLIPKDLLAPEKWVELISYIRDNQDKLFNYYRKNNEELDCLVQLPLATELHTTHELQMINKKTGKVVKTLHQVKKFELCDGVSLAINSQEEESWKTETAGTRELTKEQGKDFKETILNIASKKGGALSREEIVAVIEEVRKKRKTKVRRSGQFMDSKLQKTPIDLFDVISPTTRDKIITSDLTVKAYGIKLTPAEDKLVGAIYNLLHAKSENSNPDSELFYSGNAGGKLVSYGINNQKSKSAVLRIKPAELYKEYLGKDQYSGKEIINIKNTIKALSDKKFIIQYNRHRTIKRGKKEEVLIDRIEDVQSIIKIMSYIEGMTDQEAKSLDAGNKSIREQKEELVLALNPLLTDQINSKYVEYPSDINQRTMIASGGAMRVTESIIDLRDYMLREISVKRYTSVLNEETLINQIRLSSYAKSGRKKLVNSRIEEAINVSKKLGIIRDVKHKVGARGQIKYIFTLNKDFE